MNLQCSHWGLSWLYPAWWVLQQTQHSCPSSLKLNPTSFTCSSLTLQLGMTTWFPLTSAAQVLLYTVCHHWGLSAACVTACTIHKPASGDFSSHHCPLPAVQVQPGPGESGKRGHGKFPKVSLHHLDFKVWNQSPGGCGLQFTSFLVDGSSGALLSAGPLEKGQEPPGTPSGDRNVSNPNHDGKQKD